MSTRASLFALIAASAAVSAAGCDEASSPAALDHEQLLAVRATPPVIAAGESAAIDLLAVDPGGAPFEAAPDRVSAAGPLAGLVAEVDGAWIVTAPDAVAIDQLRAELGVDPGVPLALPVDVELSIAGVLKRAQKLVLVDGPAAPPLELAGLRVDGQILEPDAAMRAAVGVDLDLGADIEGDDLQFAWYASAGELDSYRSRIAVLRADEPGEGHLVLVVRGPGGDVAWASAGLAFE